MFPPLHLYSFQIIAKLIIIFFQLFKINKNIQDTLSLCVSRNGAKKSGTTYRCTSLLSTGGSPMSFMSFVNFSQFNLHFHEFRIIYKLFPHYIEQFIFLQGIFPPRVLHFPCGCGYVRTPLSHRLHFRSPLYCTKPPHPDAHSVVFPTGNGCDLR